MPAQTVMRPHPLQGGEVLVLVEDRPPPHAAVENVVDDPAGSIPGATRHGKILLPTPSSTQFDVRHLFCAQIDVRHLFRATFSRPLRCCVHHKLIRTIGAVHGSTNVPPQETWFSMGIGNRILGVHDLLHKHTPV